MLDIIVTTLIIASFLALFWFFDRSLQREVNRLQTELDQLNAELDAAAGVDALPFNVLDFEAQRREHIAEVLHLPAQRKA